jgi:hypothetical protein
VEPGGKTLEKYRFRRDPDSGMTDPGIVQLLHQSFNFVSMKEIGQMNEYKKKTVE